MASKSKLTQKWIKDPKFYNERELSILFSHIENERDLLMVYFMAFCGLKTAEAADLRVGDISLKNETVRVRGHAKAMPRTIPLDERIMKLWSARRKEFPRSSNARVFQKQEGGPGPLQGRTMTAYVEQYAKKSRLPYGNPTTLRNSYGVMLASRGMKLRQIMALMGIRHTDIVYCYMHRAGLFRSGTASGSGPMTRTVRLFRRLFSGQDVKEKKRPGRVSRVLPDYENRIEERRRLRYNLARGIDTLLTGPTGIGKSYLLNELRFPKVIHLRNLVPLKSAVLSVARTLHVRGCSIHGSDNASSWVDVMKTHSKAAVGDWCHIILESVQQGEWTLVIDDMTDLTRTAADLLSQLGRSFVIFGSIREIKKSLETFFWKYDRIPVGPMSKEEARVLIRHLAGGMIIADYPLFETRVLHSSARNPRAICEIIERARKEKTVTALYVRDISHTGAVKKIDMSPVFVIIAALFVAGRFIARGAGNMEAYMFAGIGGAMFMVFRMFAWRTHR